MMILIINFDAALDEVSISTSAGDELVYYFPSEIDSKQKIIEFYDIKGIESILINNEMGESDDVTISSVYLYKINKAQVNTFFGTGHENARWNGSKLVGDAINVDSPNTVDGGPVVKVTAVNPNQIIFANNQVTTINKSVTGTKNKSI